MLHVEGQQDKDDTSYVDGEGSTPHAENQQDRGDTQPQQSQAVAAHVQALQRQKIAQLEEKLEALESGHTVKQRQTIWYVAKGRAIRRVVTLFNSIEDLVAENDRRYEIEDQETTIKQDQLQIGYTTLTKTLPLFYKKGSEMEYEEYMHMLKDGDDTSKLKTLVSEWINREFKPDSPVDQDNKHSCGFTHDVCGRLLCLAELDWNNPEVRAGIRNRSDGYIVTDLSFPTYLYDKYTSNLDDLEEGLFKGKILIQAYKAVFMSPSSAKDVKGDSDGTDVISNNRRAKKSLSEIKVKKHVAQIIHLEKVTPRSIAYITCQARFALSSVTSWWSMDGDFDYQQFWQTIVDFFERAPGREAQRRVQQLLKWWTRTTSPALDNTPVVLSPNPLPNPDPTPPTPAPGTNNDDPNAYVDKLFRHWAKNSRLAFLNSHLATYHERVNRGKSQATDYVYEVVEEYFKHYHWKMKISDEPLENNPLQMESDESLSPIELTQKSQKVLAMQKAIKSWLEYRAKSPNKLIKPKALQAHQRWSKDHFETEIKSHFLKKWRKAGLPSKKMATFRDRITRKHFKKLSKEDQKHWKDTAQAEGEAAVKEWNDRLAAPPSTSPINRQAALDNLATFAGPVLAGMAEILGMHVSLLVGGPEPRKQGKITVISMHEGIDLGLAPRNWQTRDKTKFKMVTKSFQEYLSHAYTKQDCDSRRLQDDLDGLFSISQEGDQSDAEEEREATELATAKYRPKKKSKQQGTKQRRASQRKPSEASEADESSSESSSPSSGLSSSSSSSTSSSSTDSEDERQGSRWVLPFSPPKGNHGVTIFNPHHQKLALQHLEARKKDRLVNVPSPASEVPDRLSKVPDRLSKVSSRVSEVPDNTEEIDQLNEDSSVINGITSAAIIEPPAAPFDDNLIDPHIRDDPVMAANQLPKPIDNHDMDETPSAERDMEGAEDNHDNPLNTTLDKHVVNSNRVTDASPGGNISLSLSTLTSSPPWFSNPLRQLMYPTPTSPQLIQLFDKLVRLEDASSFTNEKAALGCEHRPVEVHWWISRGRKGKPTIPNLASFITQWWSWWLALQPEWRSCQAPTLTTCAILPHTDDGSWDRLNKPGANGMLSVVATLKWWADNTDGKDSRWQEAVDDVMWVLDRLIASRSASKSMVSGGNKKRGRSDTQANTPSSKRTRNRQ
ncbi:uncharacterized protein HD556DRAFT_1447110 [Suillus plorans]|uniref:Uncharacterized protein n=1 Tax=Suillus plorans TaxID=116603 RepID=A0A9P7DDP9_9AGAM|nr:uncharacterized protein HD556DRAFT_1447110 [Suillus plorans]KAG1789260.1 hypothetical protein HD556DRAFT_1447110 [Suillus plorans]